MIDLHLDFGETATASLLFDGAMAVRMKPLETPPPFDPNLSLAELIAIFSKLQTQCVDFVGSAADQVTVYRSVGLAPRTAEWLHAAAFAAGFGRLELVGLADIMPAFLSRPRSSWLVIKASRDRLEAAVLAIGQNGSASHALELSAPVDAAACDNAVLAQLERNSIDAASPWALVRELVDQYWQSADTDWSLDAREWRPGGWSAVTLNGRDVALDSIAAKALAALLDQVPADFGDGQLAIVGETAPRMEALARKLRPGLAFMRPASTDVMDAMVAYSRSRFAASTAADRAGEQSLARIELAFDARTELDPNGIELRRDYSGVYVKLVTGKRHRFDHVPAKWHRKGFAIDIIRGEQAERTQLFNRQPNLGSATFSIQAAASRTSTGSLLITVASPEFGTAALVIANPGAELLVEHFPI
jgi:hypothetical protein